MYRLLLASLIMSLPLVGACLPDVGQCDEAAVRVPVFELEGQPLAGAERLELRHARASRCRFSHAPCQPGTRPAAPEAPARGFRPQGWGARPRARGRRSRDERVRLLARFHG